MVDYIKLLNISERAKLHDSLLGKIKYIRYLAYLWYKLICWIQNRSIEHIGFDGLELNKEPRKEKIVASLTTFPARIAIVHHAIKTLFLQTYKPDRIILWLAESQFPNRLLTPELEKLQKCGLEVRFCEDYRSHKKYYLALQEQKADELVITFDDDIIYDLHSIENAVKQHQVYPDCIVVNMCHHVKFTKDKQLLPYGKWHASDSECNYPNNRNTPLTGSGCLYPYHFLRNEAFDWEVIKRTALNTDDLWIYAQILLSGRQVVAIPEHVDTFTCYGRSQEVKLAYYNCINDGNDTTIKLLIEEYPELLDLIKS